MREQKFCSKCGKINFSQYFETCECKNPNFILDSYDDYLKQKEKEKEKEDTK